MPLMTASHFFAFNAAMMESKVVFLNVALTPICAATLVPMSMSEPTGLVEPVGSDSSGGHDARVKKRTSPAAWTGGGGVPAPAAPAATASAATTPAATAMVLF